MRFQGSTDKSGAEDLQDMVGSACVVKAFNTVFADQMDKGRAEAGPLSIFVASDDDEAKQEVARMGEEIGFEVVDAGPLAAARWLEPLGYLNIHLAMNTPMGSGGGFRFQQPRARSAKGRPRRASRATQAARKPAKATEAAQSSRNRR
jgi:predicted dinucleotide-binding enzyme